ncbi:MAG: asparagine synthase (glutamine-hydrolyzing) [Elusimicrobiota bacterium]|jgi:asparagine synthase (glutamine-hydrolysing)
MCGIAGILGLGRDLTEQDAGHARAMTSLLAHRGPDGSGLFLDTRALLGNARLKVTDLSDSAALPMASEDFSRVIAYNGAATNSEALKEELRLTQRRPFRSGSDTETVLRLYEEHGIEAMRRLSGMFAFCLLDRRARKAWLVRDFFGQRPLFYARKNGRLYFASEIKAFLEIPDFDCGLDVEGLRHFFTLAYIPGERTPFRCIQELPGGHRLVVDLDSGEVRQEEYYQLRFTPDASIDEETAARRLRSALEISMERNLRTDAPAGLTLSGGVDTSCLLGLAKARGKRLHTFSIRMQEPSFDETRYQRIMTDFARPIHHEVQVSQEDVVENLLCHAAYMDEPSGDGGNIPFFLLAREASKHVKVLLTGEGGDEIFNAYETHRAYNVRRAYRRWVPAPVRAALRAGVRALPSSYEKLSLDFRLKRFCEGAELGVPESHAFWRHAFTEEQKQRLLPGLNHLPDTGRFFRDAYDRLECAEELDRLALLDLRYYFIDDLMVKNDRMLMAHSVEGRYPYMDRSVVELAASLPPSMKLRGLDGRRIQKRAMRGLVPDAILRRTNMGLEMPYSPWFLSGLRETASRCFSREHVERSGLMDFETLDLFWKEHLSGRKDHGRGLWCALSFLIWFDLFVYEKDYKRYLRPGPAPKELRAP